jgi:hypothetical protein
LKSYEIVRSLGNDFLTFLSDHEKGAVYGYATGRTCPRHQLNLERHRSLHYPRACPQNEHDAKIPGQYNSTLAAEFIRNSHNFL